jgi:hypothetical protein
MSHSGPPMGHNETLKRQNSKCNKIHIFVHIRLKIGGKDKK